MGSMISSLNHVFLGLGGYYCLTVICYVNLMTLVPIVLLLNENCLLSDTSVFTFLAPSHVFNFACHSSSALFIICSMERILERYERYSYAEKRLTATDSEQMVLYPILLSSMQFSLLSFLG